MLPTATVVGPFAKGVPHPSSPPGGVVFNAGSTDWAFGLAGGEARVERVMLNVLERLAGIRGRVVGAVGPGDGVAPRS